PGFSLPASSSQLHQWGNCPADEAGKLRQSALYERLPPSLVRRFSGWRNAKLTGYPLRPSCPLGR
ncbi:MAG: hypothetical protein ACYTEQ_24035, partial [Planctomycetota bacterium]